MPFELDWHDALPALIVTYHGQLTLREYKQLVSERAAKLSAGPPAAVVLADMRQFEGFPEANVLVVRDNLADYDTVRSTLIVLEPDQHKHLFRSVVTNLDQRLAVYFYPDKSEALDAIPRLVP